MDMGDKGESGREKEKEKEREGKVRKLFQSFQKRWKFLSNNKQNICFFDSRLIIAMSFCEKKKEKRKKFISVLNAYGDVSFFFPPHSLSICEAFEFIWNITEHLFAF